MIESKIATTGIRPSDLGSDAPMQPVKDITAYPLTCFGKKMRRFIPSWFSGREWLEYSESRDAAFCFPCHKMNTFLVAHQHRADAVFTHRGYRNWKKGFHQHESSYAHQTAMILWKDAEERKLKAKEISTMVNDEQLERNRYYMQSIVDVIFFLASSELSFRGNAESETLKHIHEHTDDDSLTQDQPCGLFVKLFHYTLTKDAKLRSIYETITKNASYTSPSFQNEIIGLLAKLVREQIVLELGDNWYSLLCDSTRDATGIENVSIVLRFVTEDGYVRERLLCIEQVTQFDAVSETTSILSFLTNHNIRLDRMLAQCYDGASVMSGRSGGVQALVQERLGRRIPYVHCFNHQLHLVVSRAVSCVDAVASFFDTCEQLYNFFRRPNIKSLYSGQSLKRVLDQRWEGYLAAARTVNRSLPDIYDVLTAFEDKIGETAVLAGGLLTRVTQLQFHFLAKCIPDLLAKLDVPNKVLQSRSASLEDAIQVMREVRGIIVDMQTADTFDRYWNQLRKDTTVS